MPHSVKDAAEKQKRREEHGLRVKGTGVGQKVKGKEWERTLKGRYVHNSKVIPHSCRISGQGYTQPLMFLFVDWRSVDKRCSRCLK
jgi:hypothetical protein